jgi:23S rRNA pseudouridine2605 synthase
MPGDSQRLQKIIAAAGLASRRHAEQLILDGRVQLNGAVVTELGTKADPERDHIRVDGKLLHGPARPRYYLVNKPKGYVTTVSDPQKRPTVMQLVAREGARLYPVGRLDFHSEGLLLMTNDGEMAHRLMHAATGIEKTYLVKVSGQPNERQIEQLRRGVMIERAREPGQGRVMTAPAAIRLFRAGENPWFEVKLIEGRNRQLRKMFEEIGFPVEKIRRIGYGPLVLDIPPGEYRELDAQEIEGLQRATRPGGNRATDRATDRASGRAANQPRRQVSAGAKPTRRKGGAKPGRPASTQ